MESYGLVLPADDVTWIKTVNDFINDNQAEIDKLYRTYSEGDESPLNWKLLALIFSGTFFLGLGIYLIKFRKPIQRKSFNQGYALLIGVGECADNRLSLPVTVNDVKKLRETLVDSRFCAYPDDENHIRLLHDREATRENILNGLDWLKNQTENDPEATIIVYYSGHGALRKSDNRYYLLQHDTNTRCLEDTALSAEDFTNKLRQIEAKRLLIIIDSCHAAGMATSKEELEKQEREPLLTRILLGFEETAYPKAFINSLNQGEGRVVFTSSKGYESSWIRPDKTMSIYTYHLIEALKGKANKRGDRCIKVSHLMNYLSTKVPASAEELCKAKQNPYFDFTTEDFPIALLRRERSS
ncbi:caspase family protein [Scytonema sp. UIC 10036]|nr:caspase family protein [Scytonema sp. UIC 10036]